MRELAIAWSRVCRLLSSGPSLSPIVYRPAPTAPRCAAAPPPKLSSRDKRALQERPPAVGPGLLRSTVAGSGRSRCWRRAILGRLRQQLGWRRLWCTGWRREPDADEVRENYMDSKFGGEGADMSEIVMG